MSDRDGGRAAERRAEQIRWRKRSRSMSQASRNMDEHLRQMNYQAGLRVKLSASSRRGKRELAQQVG